MSGRVAARLNPKPVSGVRNRQLYLWVPRSCRTSGQCVRAPGGGRIRRPSGSVGNVSDLDAAKQARVPRTLFFRDRKGEMTSPCVDPVSDSSVNSLAAERNYVNMATAHGHRYDDAHATLPQTPLYQGTLSPSALNGQNALIARSPAERSVHSRHPDLAHDRRTGASHDSTRSHIIQHHSRWPSPVEPPCGQLIAPGRHVVSSSGARRRAAATARSGRSRP